MRIEALDFQFRDGVSRTEATVVWEDSRRAPFRAFVEVERDDARPMDLEPNALLAAAAIPALRDRERRIRVEGNVCPRLRDGIGRVSARLRSWYPDLGRPARIEASGGFRSPAPAGIPRTGQLLTGGVDSVHTLVRNRAEFPPDHPASLREALFVEGLSFPESDDAKRRSLDRRGLAAVRAIASAGGLEVTRVRTNVLSLHGDLEFFSQRSHGSFLAACGLLCARVLTDFAVNASHSFKTGYRPWGSHPEIDPEFSTSAVAVRYQGEDATRLEKVREIARSSFLDSLFVCGQGPWPEPYLNCGACEKCVRTRIELLLGAGVDAPPTFPPGPVTGEMVDRTPMLPAHRRLYFWGEIATSARSAGQRDLAEAIDRLRRRWQVTADWLEDRGWKGRLRRIDRKLFGGAMLGVSRKLRPASRRR